MKKLMVLLMVLAMASLATAQMTLLITVGPEGAGVDIGPEYIMNPGETVWIGVEHTWEPANCPGYGCYLTIADDPQSQASGAWIGGNNIYIPPPSRLLITTTMVIARAWAICGTLLTTRSPAKFRALTVSLQITSSSVKVRVMLLLN